MDIGKIIQSLREKKDMTQKELADRINISYSVMNRIESGKRAVRDEEIIKIAEALGTNANYLLGNSDTKNPYKEDDLPDDFATPEEAMDFLLNKNVIMGFTGFDIHKLTDEEKTQYARDLLDHLKLLSLKYKK